MGENLLAASVGGDIFASPSTKQILAAVDAVPSKEGTILVVTNYTGDCLHFGLANEKAIARGHRCRMLVCGDDVSVGKTNGSLVGRRGLAGQIGVLKVMGGAAGQGASLDDVYDLGVAFSQQIVSIAATLDHCHVPGRTEHAVLADDEVEIGTGPHNEPGYKRLSPAPSAEELVRMILTHCLDEKDPERGYVRFNKGDETMLLISNFGGISPLEIGALTDEILDQLSSDWGIEPVRVYVGPLETYAFPHPELRCPFGIRRQEERAGRTDWRTSQVSERTGILGVHDQCDGCGRQLRLFGRGDQGFRRC